VRFASHSFVAGTRAVLVVAVVFTLGMGLAACKPEPTATESPSSTTTPSPSPTVSAGDASGVATPQPGADITLPAACENIYSAGMLASLTADNPPLNDASITMTSTQNVDGLETLSSGVPTLRCTWGQGGQAGLATNVSIVSAEQSQALLGALANAGFACEPSNGGITCSQEQTVINQDDKMVTIIETHVFRGNGWISTTSIDFAPDGYTADIVSTLWG